jgi:hypothetical protein
MKILKAIAIIVIIIVVISITLDLGSARIREIEKAECQEWKNQSELVIDWYATGWQIEQCNFFDISLPNIHGNIGFGMKSIYASTTGSKWAK